MKHYLDVIYQDFQGVGPELVDLLDVFPEQEGLVSIGVVDQFVVRYLEKIYFKGHQVQGNGNDAKTGVNFQYTILLAIFILLYEVFTKFYLSIRNSDYSMLRFVHVFY